MAETPLELAYDSALQALSHQAASLDELRTRTGILLAAASVSTSFLGSEALKGRDTGTFGWLAVVCFFGLGALTAAILWPRRGWLFVVDPILLIRDFIEIEMPLDIEKMRRDLALHLSNNYRSNSKKLNFLQWMFQLACGLLILEVIAWVVALTQR